MADIFTQSTNPEDETPQVFAPETVEAVPTGAPVSDDVLQVRASKFQVATDGNYDQILSDLRSGREQQIRDNAVTQEQLAMATQKNAMIQEYFREIGPEGEFLPQDIEFIANLSATDFRELSDESGDQSTILERLYAERVTDKLAARSEMIEKALSESTDETLNTIQVTSRIIQNQEIAKRVLQDMEAQYKKLNPLAKGLDFVETLVPGASWLNTRNIIQSDESSSLLSGSNIEQQIEEYYTLTPKEAAIALQAVIQESFEDNSLDAIRFLQALVSYSRNDALYDNVFSVLDAADVATIGLGGVARRALSSATRRGVRDQMKAVVKSNGSIEGGGGVASVVEAVGDMQHATMLRVLEKSLGKNVGLPIAKRLDSVVGNLSSLFNPRSAMAGQSRLSTGRATLANSLHKSAMELLSVTSEVARVNRLGTNSTEAGKASQAMEAAFENTERLIDAELNVNNNIMDLKRILPEQSIDSVGKITALVGKNGATPFKSERAAKQGATRYGLLKDSYEIEKVGADGYALRIDYDVAESGESIQNALRTEPSTSTPLGLMNMTMLGMVRGSKEVLSDSSNVQRLAATTGIQKVRKIVKEAMEEVGTLSKKSKERLNRTIEFNRATGEGETKGKLFDNTGQLEDHFVDQFGVLPTDQEVLAYFKLKQMSDFDYFMRDLSIYKDMAFRGTRRNVVKLKQEDGSLIETDAFNGFDIKELPEITSNTPYSFVINEGTGARVKKFNSLTGPQQAQLRNRIHSGELKAIQLFDPKFETAKFSDAKGFTSKTRVSVVLTPERQVGPLQFGNLPYKHGGHHDTAHKHYLKQRDMLDGAYTGDKAILGFDIRAQGQKYHEYFNKARVMLKDAKGRLTPELKDFIETNLPLSPQRFRKLFYAKNHAFDINEDFVLTDAGQRISDVQDMSRVPNQLDSPHNAAYYSNNQYTQERSNEGLLTIQEEAGADVKAVSATMVDPLTSITRGVNQIIEAGLLTDLKQHEGRTFMAQFGHLLENNSINPVAAVLNPKWKQGSSVNGEEIAAAKAVHANLMAILSKRSPEQRWMDTAITKLEDHMYNKQGGGSKVLGTLGIAMLKDPFVFMRKVAFHSKLGLFNPIQLIVQGQGVINVLAFSPKYGMQGASAATLSRLLSASNGSDDIIKAMSTKGLGISSDEFIASHKEMKRRGFDLIEDSNALVDDVIDTPLFKSGPGKMLDTGRFFFDQAEKFVRTTAWHTAFLEYKRANPNTRLLSGDYAKIANRADDLGANMLRNSNSVAQKGLLSVPMQFFTYQQRLAELFLGKRIPFKDKMKAFAVYSAAYGIPTAAGAATMVPFYESFKEAMISRGQEYDENFVTSTLSGGVVKGILQAMTGEEYAVSEAYGPVGLTQFRDMFEDATMLEILGGASFSITGDFLKALSPMLWHAEGLFHADPQAGYKLTSDDWLDLASNVSTFNYFRRFASATETGKYMTRNDIPITNLDTRASQVLHMLRIDKQNVLDTFSRMKIMKSEKEALAQVQKEISEKMQLGYRLLAEGLTTEAEKEFQKVQALRSMFPMTHKQFTDSIGRALNANKNLDQQINQKWFLDRSTASPENSKRRFDQILKQGGIE